MTLDLVILIGDTADVTKVVGGDEQPETFKMIIRIIYNLVKHTSDGLKQNCGLCRHDEWCTFSSLVCYNPLVMSSPNLFISD